MSRWWRYALVAVVAVALLSVGVESAVRSSLGQQDPENCASGRLSVFEDTDVHGETVEYGDLTTTERKAIDSARRAEDRTVTVDGSVVSDLPAGVVIDGTQYRVSAYATDCPLISGTPRALDPLWSIFVLVHHVFSGLYVPAGAVIAVVLGYRKVDEWLRF